MFNKKQIVRNVIYAIFCALILMISFTLTYYITYYEINEESKEVHNLKHVEIEDEKGCNNEKVSYFIYSLCFKLMAAFFAGGILSDGLYIRLGVI